MSQPYPLHGVKVVELATFIAAPCCTRFLADLGAEVVKVEAPMGDPLRFTAVNEGRPFGDKEDTSYTLENTGKKLITLNIKTEKGRKVLEELIAQADVFVTNNRLNALKKNGLDYDTLHARYPKLVFAMVSGYGEKGPDKDLPGFDFTSYFARAGILGTMFDVNAVPMLPIAGFGDHQVGINLAAGVLAALYRARETGIGDEVIVSLFHSGVWDVSLYLQSAQYGVPTAQYPIRRNQIANQFQLTHKTSDGRWVQLAIPQYDKFYNKFVSEVLRRDDLVDNEKFYPQSNLQKHADEFYDIMVEEIGRMSYSELRNRMEKADLPYALCQTWDEVLKDEQAWASDILAKVKFPNGEERTMVRTPVIFGDTDLPSYERASFMGEQTREVLAMLGYSAEQIDAMIAAGEAQDVKRIG